METMLMLLTCCIGHVAGELVVIDMTHILSYDTIFWAGNPKYNFTILKRGQTTGGYWYESNALQTAEHGGTHVDAPVHFYKGSWRTEQIPMKNLIGPGVIINVKDKAASDPDYRVLRSDVDAWERKHGRIPKGAVVIMNSGWKDKFPNRNAVFNTTDPNDPSTYHFPGWHEDAVRMLTDQRHVNVIGVDTPSTDYGQSTTFPVHVILGSTLTVGVENVANLDEVPEKGAMIYAAVVKLYDGSGGPARVFATYDDAVTDAAFSVSFSMAVVILLQSTLYMVL